MQLPRVTAPGVITLVREPDRVALRDLTKNHFFFPFGPSLAGCAQCLGGGDLFPARIHVVNVEGSISDVEEQARARAAEPVDVMTGHGRVGAGGELERRPVLHRP